MTPQPRKLFLEPSMPSTKVTSSKKPSLTFHTPGSVSPLKKGPFSPAELVGHMGWL